MSHRNIRIDKLASFPSLAHLDASAKVHVQLLIYSKNLCNISDKRTFLVGPLEVHQLCFHCDCLLRDPVTEVIILLINSSP